MLWLLALSLVAAARGGSEPMTPDLVKEVGAIAEAGMKRQALPGLAVVVMRGDEVVLSRGFGLEDVARPDAVSAKTVFALNSISKQFVAALILKLSEEGKLALDDPVSRHLPDFRHAPATLTVRHLLNHTSGMREETAQPQLMELFDRPGTTFAEYLAVARETPSDWSPGSRWSYGNINYLMLTVIAERVTGQRLEIAIRERFLEPLGLTSIGLCAPPLGEKTGEARGHISRDGTLVPHPPENIGLFRGSGGFCGNAVDLARWMRALATGKVVGEESYRQMATRAEWGDGRKAEYGLAMDLGTHAVGRRHGHGGYGGGFSAQAAYYPETGLGLVVLANRFVFVERIEQKIARRLLGRAEPKRRAVELSAAERKRYLGAYDLGIHDWPARITESEGKLFFELRAPPLRLPLTYLGDHQFVSADDVDGYRLTFSAEEPAREVVLVGMGMMTWYGRRQE